MIIAIDGPAAAGKGTLARRLAAHFDFAYLDSGALYRAVGAKALDQSVDLDDINGLVMLASGLIGEDMAHPHLRTPAVSEAASRVAALTPVREARPLAKKPVSCSTGVILGQLFVLMRLASCSLRPTEMSGQNAVGWSCGKKTRALYTTVFSTTWLFEIDAMKLEKIRL